MSNVTLKFNNGSALTLRETAAKDGHIYLAARPAQKTAVSRFGFNVDSNSVFKTADVQTLTHADVIEDGKTVGRITLRKDVTAMSGKPSVVGVAGVKVKVNGDEQTLKIERISQPRDSQANVLIRSARPSNSGNTVLTSL